MSQFSVINLMLFLIVILSSLFCRDYVLLTENEWRIFSNFVPYDREIKLSNCRTNGDEKALSFSISHGQFWIFSLH